MPGIHCHIVAAELHVGPFMLPVMACEDQVLFVAVFIPGFCPSVNEEVQESLCIVMPDFFPVANFFKKRWKLFSEVIFPFFHKGVEEIRGPSDTAGRFNLRLISEGAGDCFPEFIANVLFITCHCKVYEFLSHTGYKQVDIRKTSVPVGFSIIGL